MMCRIRWVGLGMMALAWSGSAYADSMRIGETIDYQPTFAVGVVQATPGIHVGMRGRKVVLGASVDVLGGIVFGDRDFAVAPGMVIGPYGEVHVVLKEGVSTTLGLRGGLGGLAPTLGGGFVPFGLATFDYAKGYGTRSGDRFGLHVRSVAFGVGASGAQDEPLLVTLGVEVPLVPVPAMS